MAKSLLKEHVRVFAVRAEYNIKSLNEITLILNRIGLDKLASEIDNEVGTIRHELNRLKIAAGCEEKG